MEKQQIKTSDEKARSTAIYQTAKNILVQAGAGTGKTTLLTDRLCYLILGKNIPIDKIIALTFTEKAAAEIKSQLLQKMQNISYLLKELPIQDLRPEKKQQIISLTDYIVNIKQQQSPDKTTQDIKNQIIKDIDANFELAERAVISTMHSFCLKILRQFSTEAKIAPDCKPVNRDALNPILDKTWTSFLNEELAFNSPNAELWQSILGEVSLNDVKDFAFSLLELPLKDYTPQKNYPFITGKLKEFKTQLQYFIDTYPVRKQPTKLDNAIKNALDIFTQTILYLEKQPYQKVAFNKQGFSITKQWKENPQDYQKAKELIDIAKHSTIDNLELFNKTYQAIKDFIPKAQQALLQTNIITFDDIILKTRDLIKNYPHIRQTLKEEYKSILLDEFQDTDPEQGEIFIYLSEKQDTCAEDWQEVKLQAGKLFIVGDPKQSIYRFRGADITAYDNFCDLMIKQNADRCFLQNNFRSAQNIVDFTNIFGQSQIQENKGIQPPYVKINHTINYNLQPIQFLITSQQTDANKSREAQAAVISQWIKQNAGKTKLTDGKTISYKDIAVLFPTNTGLNFLIEAFRNTGINYSVEENKNFYRAQEVKDILNLLKLAQNPADKIALTGVLRGPLCLVQDKDILELSQNNELNIFKQTQNPYINNCYGQLKEIYRLSQTLPLEEFINYLIFNTRFKEMEILCCSNEQVSANITKFADMARQFINSGIITLPQLIFHIENYIKQKETEGESPVAEQSLDTVKLMTIHKSKGLQFPVVILFDITKSNNEGYKNPPPYLKDYTSRLSAPKIGNKYDIVYAFIKQKNEIHKNAEKLRLLYVALTRAKEMLVIAGNSDANKTFAQPLLNAGCYPDQKTAEQNTTQDFLHGLCKVVNIDYESNIPFNNNWDLDRQQTTPVPIALWQQSWLSRCKQYACAIPNKSIAPSTENKQTDISVYQSSAMLSGTIAHRIIAEKLKGNNININNIAIMEDINLNQNKKEIQTALKITQDFFESDIFKTLSSKKLIAAETPFTFKSKNGLLVNGIIDAVFEDENSNIFIAEFKTDNINKEQAFKNACKYKTQIEQYIKAAALMFPDKKIEGAIIFIVPQIICNLGEI